MYKTKGMGRIHGMNGTIAELKITRGKSITSNDTFGRASKYSSKLLVQKKPS